jgi:hypothetical protein
VATATEAAVVVDIATEAAAAPQNLAQAADLDLKKINSFIKL